MLKPYTALARIVAVLALIAFASAATAQQNYPSKLIRLISPNAPGGGTTILAHLIGEKLTESWGKPVIVDNRPGGNGIIGGETLAHSPPDGYTLMSMTNTHIITPFLLPTPYDAIKDFTAVATIASSELLLVIHPSVPANNLQELIALATSKPGRLNFASSGSGSVTHLEAELFNMVVGVKIQHIPYKGSGPALTELIGGHVQMYFGPPNNALPHVQSGRLKAMAVGGEARLPALPQVPTFTEAGVPNVDLKVWWGLLAPAGTPKAVVDTLSNETAKIVVMPDIKKKLAELGMNPFVSTPDQFTALMKTLTVKFGNIIKTANVRID